MCMRIANGAGFVAAHRHGMASSGCGYNDLQGSIRRHEGRVERSHQPISTPGRPDSQFGEHGQRIRCARKGDTGKCGAGACQGHECAADAGLLKDEAAFKNSRRHSRACPARSDGCSRWRKTIPTSKRIRVS